eukprot:m.49719 g.49719  ORF g.49719 m.49719 type:complete len:536 (+) comp6492_c0_seq1:47-1654(+)
MSRAFGALSGPMVAAAAAAAVAAVASAAAAFYCLKSMRLGSRRSAAQRSSDVLKFGLLDRWYSASHDAGSMICFCLVAHLDGGALARLSEAQVRALLATAVSKVLSSSSPLLRAFCDDNDDGEGRFTVIEEIDVAGMVNYVSRASDGTWEAEMDAQVMMPFARGQPQWRVVAVHAPGSATAELILSLHHGLCDGIASTHVLRELLLAIKSLSGGIDGDTQTLASDAPRTVSIPHTQHLDLVHVPVEYLVDMRPSLGSIVYEVLADRLPALRQKETAWLGPPHDPVEMSPSKRRPQSQHLVLGNDEVQQLLSACRNHRTTMHAAVCAAAHRALCGALAADGDGDVHVATAPTTLSMMHAINLRDRGTIPLGPEHLRAYVCGVVTSDPMDRLDDDDGWQLANSIRQRALSQIVAGQQQVGLLGFLSGSWQAFFQRRKSRPPHNGRDTSLGVSNLGRVPMPHKCGVLGELQGVLFSQSKHGEGPVIHVSLMTTSLDNNIQNLRVHIGFPAPLVSPALGATFAKNLGHELRSLAGLSPS